MCYKVIGSGFTFIFDESSGQSEQKNTFSSYGDVQPFYGKLNQEYGKNSIVSFYVLPYNCLSNHRIDVRGYFVVEPYWFGRYGKKVVPSKGK